VVLAVAPKKFRAIFKSFSNKRFRSDSMPITA
jgi:hypothetical protein